MTRTGLNSDNIPRFQGQFIHIFEIILAGIFKPDLNYIVWIDGIGNIKKASCIHSILHSYAFAPNLGIRVLLLYSVH